MDMVQQIYLDAEFKERIHLQLKQIVINLENKI